MSKPERGAFRDFILTLPLDMDENEVVARGKKAGLKFAAGTVRSTRHRAKQRSAPTTRLKDLKARVRAGDDLSEPQTPEPETLPVPVLEPMTGAAFVRTQPLDMPVVEVLAKAREAGISVSASGVHQARSVARRREKSGLLHPSYPAPSITRGFHFGRSPKREFVRSLPMDMPTDEVLARAEAAGISLTKQSVHQTRFDMRNRTVPREGLPPPPGASRSAARVSRASRQSEAPGDASREAKRQAFKALILELGMDDAESIWEDFAAIRRGIRR